MVGKRKQFNKTCPSLRVETYVPKNNFYRQIKQLLKVDFLYQGVAPYYGKCGQKWVDPVIFFKLQLVAHFENIYSDQALIEKSGLRLDILYFLGLQFRRKTSWTLAHNLIVRSATALCLVHVSNYLPLCLRRVSNTF